MTQRSIQHPQHAPAHRAARAHACVARAKRIDAVDLNTTVINVALASLVLVVVLITTLTGAG